MAPKKRWNVLFAGLLSIIVLNMIVLFSSHQSLQGSAGLGGITFLTPPDSHVHLAGKMKSESLVSTLKNEKASNRNNRVNGGAGAEGSDGEDKNETDEDGDTDSEEDGENDQEEDGDNDAEEDGDKNAPDDGENDQEDDGDNDAEEDGDNDAEEDNEEDSENVKGEDEEKSDGDEGENDGEDPSKGNKKDQLHLIAGLSCDAFGGPEDPSEMIYWQDVPSDSLHVSPLKTPGTDVKYLTFEPDFGGWNNIRMSMETAVTMAHAMGRTLVMPPQQSMYLLGDQNGDQKHHFTFTDFFHFDSVAAEHAGVEVISMEEFLQREVMTGNMKINGSTTFPPMNNRTNWNNAPGREINQFNDWMRSFTLTPIWRTDDCMVGIPARPGTEGPNRLRDLATPLQGRDYQARRAQYVGKPVAVDAPAVDRLDELLVERKKVCVYDETYQNAKVIHMMGDDKMGLRLLIHFYAFLFFEDWKHDLWTKRFVRDHIRYADEIQCAAARVVKALRQKAIEHGNKEGFFDTMHIRRGDFQYKDTRINADAIYENIKELIPAGATVFIATDERKKDFFDVFRGHFNVYFLDDFKEELKGVNTNFYGMIDQRIASRGRSFIGCYYSTFTGYINRMRGYHSQKEKAEGWERGAIKSWYYVPLGFKDVLRDYWPLSPPLWAREFPTAWRDLDHGIAELAAERQAQR